MDVNITELIENIYNATNANESLSSMISMIGPSVEDAIAASTFAVSTTASTTSPATTEFVRPARNSTAAATPQWVTWFLSGRVQIPLYATILLLAVIGNGLVILTLVQNRRMRTITNVFLLNLAVSDILLGVLCMPFTLIGSLLRDFVFGEIMCKFLPYLQGKWNAGGACNLFQLNFDPIF